MSQKGTIGAALKSMTGYAQARREQDGWAMRVSLRSVNHRFLDLHLRLPEGMDMFEPRIRQRVRERLRRGHVDVTLHYELAGSEAVQLNQNVAEAYLKATSALRKKFKLKAEPDLGSLLRLPGVISAGGLSGGILSDEEQARLGSHVEACLDDALERLEEMRRTEGRQLAAEMKAQLKQIAERCEKVERLAEISRPAYARRLQTRVQELLGDTALDPARLAQEAALLAERGDISEEIARLRSHVTQFHNLLGGSGEVGKKLDFLLQEMQREANTMLSKTPGVEGEGLSITDLALEVKSEIEKLREQVQNVE